MPRILPKSPCAMRSTRPEPQRWSGKSDMIIHSIRTGAVQVPVRDQTTAEQRRSSLNNRIGSCGVLASAKSRKIRGTGPALWQPLPMAQCVRTEKRKNGKRTVEPRRDHRCKRLATCARAQDRGTRFQSCH